MTLIAEHEAPSATGGEHPPRSQACTTRPRARASLVDQPTERLEADVIDLSSRLSAGTYELLVLVGEIDARGSFATWGSLSCAAWLADVCAIEVCTARTQVRIARAMRAFPALDAAMASGDISYAKARVLAACLTPDNADALLEIAERTPRRKAGRPPSPHGRNATNTPRRSGVDSTRHDPSAGAPSPPARSSSPPASPRKPQVRCAPPSTPMSPGTTRVLDEVQHECAHPGCHATVFLQYDHVRPYDDDGPTVLANLQRLCGPHNQAKEAARRGR